MTPTDDELRTQAEVAADLLSGPRRRLLDEPAPSPSAMFGRRPSWLKRLFSSELDRYWPTHRDVLRFRDYMRAHPLPNSLSLVGPRSFDVYEERRRWVKMVRDDARTSHALESFNAWWELNGEEEFWGEA